VSLTLNARALQVVDDFARRADELRITVTNVKGARLLDCGIQAPGGIEAGLALARVCMAGFADIDVVPGEVAGVPLPCVQVRTDHPIAACMASQYAGWQVAVGKFFAMGSGPMRAAWGREKLFDDIPGREKPGVAVGVLETRKPPTDEVIDYLAEQLGLPPEKIHLLVAPASSIAGTLQVVARSLETALHKLHELKFDLTQVVSGYGVAPLPPVAADEMRAIGRTNDAILCGGKVVIWVRGDDAQLAEVVKQVPSSASADHGAPFAAIFERYNRDFYKIDPMLFSPAVVILQNLTTGRCHLAGKIDADVMQKSFFE
jgi:methenyltetrahydromethanopterin cyclohydrolase